MSAAATQSTALDICRRNADEARGRKDANRAAFPFAAAMLDDHRKHGFDEARVTWAEENGRTVGRRVA